jgi:uncharacterized protein YukE
VTYPDPELLYAKLAAGDVGRISGSAEPVSIAISKLDEAKNSISSGTSTTSTGWTGAAASAFSARANQTSTVIDTARGRLDTAHQVIMTAAGNYGTMRNAADRVIEAWRARPADLDPAIVERVAIEYNMALGQLRDSYEIALRALAKTLAGIPRAFAPGGDADIPPPPPEPESDEGAGEFDSDPWWSIVDDLAKQALAYDAAEALGYTDAARHLRHYLDESGDDLTVDPDHIMRDVPSFQSAADQTVATEIDRIAQDAAASWQGHYLTEQENPNWFYAMGGIQYSTTGVVTVHPPEHPGGQPRVEVDYQTHVWDRYNWDGGKAVTIGPITIEDESLAEMHRASVAQEYDMVGTSDTYHYSGPAPAQGQQPDLPNAPDDRGGGRDDPGRPR